MTQHVIDQQVIPGKYGRRCRCGFVSIARTLPAAIDGAKDHVVYHEQLAHGLAMCREWNAEMPARIEQLRRSWMS